MNNYFIFFLKIKINTTRDIIILIGIKYSGFAIREKLKLFSSIKISSNPCPILAYTMAQGKTPKKVVKKN